MGTEPCVAAQDDTREWAATRDVVPAWGGRCARGWSPRRAPRPWRKAGRGWG